jgi:hypothetical protein
MSDRALGAFKAIIERFTGNRIIGPRVDFLASYPATAVTQNGDGTLEIQPDDSRLPSLSSVPIRYGIPGVSAQIANGGRVLLAFAGGDPARPIATVWESASVLSLTVAASVIKLGGAGATEALVKGTSYAGHMAQLATAATALAAAMTTDAGASTGPLAPLAPGFTSAATAATSLASAATSLAADISAQNTTI